MARFLFGLVSASVRTPRPKMALLQTKSPRFFQLLSGIRSLVSLALQVLWYIRGYVLQNTNLSTLDSSVYVLLPCIFADELCDKPVSGLWLL